jgi:hypothetical protein
VRPAGQTEQIAGPQIVGVAVNQGEPQSFAVRQEPLASPSVHTRPNSVFTACLILVLDKIQSLDHARWGSLQRDSYSRTTIRHSSKPGPWCRRTRERYRRNRHNRSPLSHLADLCSGALSDGDVGRDPEPPWSSPSGTVTRLRSYRRPDSQADEKSAMPDTALLHCPAASAMARHLRNCEAAASAVRQGVIAAARIGATSEVRPHSSPASSRLPRSEKGSAPSRSCIVTKGRCNTIRPY